MKRVEYFGLVANLFQFKTVTDEDGNEYVLLADNGIDSLEQIEDKTEFEAIQNHVHLLDRITKKEIRELTAVGMKLGQALLESLRFHYPNKEFIVFVSMRLKHSFIIRFHQKWKGEEPYYNPEDFDSEEEKVLMFEM